MLHRFYLSFISAIVFLFAFSHLSFANHINGAVMPIGECDKGINTQTNGAGDCYWARDHMSDGIALFYGPTKMGTSEALMSDGFDKSYVPYAGLYKLRTRACASQTAGNCLIAKSTEYFDAVRSIMLNSSERIIDQTPGFGGGSGTLSGPSRLCFTFVAPDGSEWKTSSPRTCQDAYALPESPAFCYLNMGTDFNVDLGSIERSSISPVPGGITKKTLPLKVMCIGDASQIATFTLQYTPITIPGIEIVSSSIQGVGIAISINDKVMSLNDSMNVDFGPGVTEVRLGFEVLRAPGIDIGDIATGDFTADAILILTKH
ncbi:hypothetical protein LJPFL01_3461 [Lelliottia jeotgali]|nr:hypothetical protein LJPFL01_3461 [Lelliottia jeotgali]